jgi:hypothetical protein
MLNAVAPSPRGAGSCPSGHGVSHCGVDNLRRHPPSFLLTPFMGYSNLTLSQDYVATQRTRFGSTGSKPWMTHNRSPAERAAAWP